MLLKKIEIQGFKSFPDKTTIEFDGGVTAIVGPNGSGKSNIADAVLWVMGEQSARMLRGEKMEDVIFSGTEKRGPVGFAQVTLVVDNRSRMLDMNEDEVCISRRVYRSGENEYSLNHTPCRLRDITELMMDTGVGRDGYSMIGQGRIESILSGKPDERRQIFEEAAGISKYRYKKQEAERKLKSTEENLVRVTDIVGELEKQVGPLYRQQKKAREYLEYRENLKALEVSVALESIEKLRERQAAAHEMLQEREGALAAVQARLEEKQTQQRDVYEALSRGDAEIERLRGEILELTKSAGESRQEGALFEREIEYKRRDAGEKRSQAGEQEKAMEEIRQRRSEADGKYRTLSALRSEAQEKLDALNEQLAAFDGAHAMAGGTLAEREVRLHALRQEAEAARQAETEGRVQEESLRSRLQGLLAELSAREEEAEGYRLKKQAEQEETLAQEARMQRAEQESGKAERLLALARDGYQAAYDDEQKIAAQLAGVQSKLALYTEAQNEMEGFGFGVKKIMERSKGSGLPGGKIYGPVGLLVSAEKRYATAVEVALGGHSRSVVTEDEAAAKSAIAYLKKNRFGRVTFLPLTSMRVDRGDDPTLAGETGFLGYASDFVSYAPEVEAAVLYCLARTAVVDTLDHALALARRHRNRLRIVTLEGELLSPGGSVTGGSVSQSSGAVSRGAQIAALQEECGRLSESAAKAQEKLQLAQESMEQQEALLESARRAEMEEKQRLLEAQTHLEQYDMILEAVAKDIESRRAECVLLERQADERCGDVRQLRERVQQMQRETEALEQELQQSRSEASEAARRREELDRDGLRQRLALESFDREMRTVYDTMMTLDRQAGEAGEAARRLEEEAAQLDEEVAELESDIAFKAQQAVELEAECLKREEQIRAVQQSRSGASETAAALQEEMGQLTRELLECQREHDGARHESEKAETELEGIYDRLWEDYELTYSSALELRQELEGTQLAQAEISKIKSLLRSMGSVNVDAIEQYREVKERFDFLSTQRDDLVKAAQELREMIVSVTKIMQTQFRDNFARIAKQFSVVFRELFGGGRGELSLADPDNVLESPIEIVVQPKGKRLQSISLLSGGEKALGAIAIVFAILSVKPTPFCIFDEIEAALDDVNVYRFADYFRKFAGHTQFIVITHRRGTMEAADTLFGVTMQEKGISQLLPLKVADIA